MIPYGRQDITEEDISEVVAVLKSDFLTQGPAIERFEKAFAEYCGARYAVAVSSCTAALHLACMALGLKPGDRFWTVPNTFVATANAGLYCGGAVDFVDIDARTWNMSVTALEEKLKAAKAAGMLPKIVLPVHFSGQSCDMKAIRALSEQYGFKIIEDAAHCAGASYAGGKVGSCKFSDLCVFSFHPVKIITTGEGGIITTNSKDIYEKLLRLRTHGITRETGVMQKTGEGAWYFEQLELGYHYRITDIQAALGLSQLKRLDSYVQKRKQLAEKYAQKLKNLPLTLPVIKKDCDSSWHLYAVRLQTGKISKTRKEVFDAMRDKNIGVNVHYIPVHLHPYYKELGFSPGDYPESEAYYAQALTLPLFPALKDEEQDYICDTLAEILKS